MPITGTAFLAELQALPNWKARSAAALAHILAGDVPSWLKTRPWYPVEATITDGTTHHTLRYFVSPDPLSVGDDLDALPVPLIPTDAQAAADHYNAILPTRRMVQAIHQAARRKFPLSVVTNAPYSIPLKQIESVEAVRAARLLDQSHSNYDPNTGLQSGQRKAIVIGPALDGSHVAIYGGGGGGVDGYFIQDYSTIHFSSYTDYSHGTWLVSRRAFLDGVEIDLATIFTDPVLYRLVSDQGMFVPRFPNKGLTVASAPPISPKPPITKAPKPSVIVSSPPKKALYVSEGVASNVNVRPIGISVSGAASAAGATEGIGIGGALAVVVATLAGVALVSHAAR